MGITKQDLLTHHHVRFMRHSQWVSLKPVLQVSFEVVGSCELNVITAVTELTQKSKVTRELLETCSYFPAIKYHTMWTEMDGRLFSQCDLYTVAKM